MKKLQNYPVALRKLNFINRVQIDLYDCLKHSRFLTVNCFERLQKFEIFKTFQHD